eukprot:s5842_g1.t1
MSPATAPQSRHRRRGHHRTWTATARRPLRIPLPGPPHGPALEELWDAPRDHRRRHRLALEVEEAGLGRPLRRWCVGRAGVRCFGRLKLLGTRRHRIRLQAPSMLQPGSSEHRVVIPSQTETSAVTASSEQAARRAVGTTLEAVSWVMQAKAIQKNAWRFAAHGGCILNETAVAVRNLLARHPQSKVVVLDLDAHFGDGTAWQFYESPFKGGLSIFQVAAQLLRPSHFRWRGFLPDPAKRAFSQLVATPQWPSSWLCRLRLTLAPSEGTDTGASPPAGAVVDSDAGCSAGSCYRAKREASGRPSSCLRDESAGQRPIKRQTK